MIAGLVACGGPYPSHTPKNPCTTDRCVDDVASARSDGVGNNLTGYSLAQAGDELYVAAPKTPCFEGCGVGCPHVDVGRDDAITILDGEQPGDGFGRRVLTVDADGDVQRDLVITADTWPGGDGRGAVWLVPGAALP